MCGLPRQGVRNAGEIRQEPSGNVLDSHANRALVRKRIIGQPHPGASQRLDGRFELFQKRFRRGERIRRPGAVTPFRVRAIIPRNLLTRVGPTGGRLRPRHLLCGIAAHCRSMHDLSPCRTAAAGTRAALRCVHFWDRTTRTGPSQRPGAARRAAFPPEFPPRATALSRGAARRPASVANREVLQGSVMT